MSNLDPQDHNEHLKKAEEMRQELLRGKITKTNITDRTELSIDSLRKKEFVISLEDICNDLTARELLPRGEKTAV